MGRARIQSGGTKGRYSIQVDYGSAQRAALLAAFNRLINRYDADIIGQQADVDVINGMLQDQIGRINEARDGVMPEGFPELAEPPANKPPGSPIDKQLQQLVITSILNGSNILRANLRRYTLNIEKMKMERADALKKVATLTTAQATVTKDAWCCTYTETAPAGAQVATIDVNGETDLTLVAPNARAWAPADGVMTMPHVMSPEQSFFNTAILPGWQKHRPRYRWGTITALDVDADTASVSLAPATSSAQRLDINLFSTLSNIPVEYMTCNAGAFEVGDRCIVEFIPGALSGDLDARVIGFLDNPRPCLEYIARYFLNGHPNFNSGGSFLFNEQEINRPEEEWEPVTAPAPVGATRYFYGWNDGVGTLNRSDGIATESITKTAIYQDAGAQFKAYTWLDYRAIQTGTTTVGEGNSPAIVFRIEVRVAKERLAIAALPDFATAPWTGWQTLMTGVAAGGYQINQVMGVINSPFIAESEPGANDGFNPADFVQPWPGGMPRPGNGAPPSGSYSDTSALPGGRTLTVTGTSTTAAPSGGMLPPDVLPKSALSGTHIDLLIYNTTGVSTT
jgi:hypothetical protein